MKARAEVDRRWERRGQPRRRPSSGGRPTGRGRCASLEALPGRLMVNHKRVYRLYRAKGLTVRIERRKWLAASFRVAPPSRSRPSQRWPMDFVRDHTAEGLRFRVLTLVDDFSRRFPGLLVERSIGGGRVVRFLVRRHRSSKFEGRSPKVTRTVAAPTASPPVEVRRAAAAARPRGPVECGLQPPPATPASLPSSM